MNDPAVQRRGNFRSLTMKRKAIQDFLESTPSLALPCPLSPVRSPVASVCERFRLLSTQWSTRAPREVSSEFLGHRKPWLRVQRRLFRTLKKTSEERNPDESLVFSQSSCFESSGVKACPTRLPGWSRMEPAKFPGEGSRSSHQILLEC